MTLDHKQRRLRHKIHLFVSFLGLLLRETDQKRVIYVNLKKNGENDHFCAPVHAAGLEHNRSILRGAFGDMLEQMAYFWNRMDDYKI